MGIIQHNVVLATTCDKKEVESIKKFIKSTDYPELFYVAPEVMNGHITVVMLPDGSNYGQYPDDEYDELRSSFIDKIGGDENGETSWRWVEMAYGEWEPQIIRGHNLNNMW